MDVINHPKIAELAPLPNRLALSAFERFMLREEQPDYPMTFYVELVFAGEVDPQALQQAINLAVERNPLLRARIQSEGNEPYWTFNASAKAPIHRVSFDHFPNIPHQGGIDLTKEPGVRIWYGTNPGQTQMLLQFHHASCDGQGARRFVVDLFTGYAQLAGDRQPVPQWDRLDKDRLQLRDTFSLLPGTRRTSFREKLRNAYGFHRVAPKPLCESIDSRNTGVEPKSPLLLRHTFERATTSAILKRARTHSATLNDIAVAFLLRTLARWNQTHGDAPNTDWLRVLVPMDLRTGADSRLPAMNRMGFSFLARRMADCQNQTQLFQSVHEEMNYFKQTRIGVDFIEGLTLVERLSAVFPSMLTSSGCMATAVLTTGHAPSRRFQRRFPTEDQQTIVGNLRLQRISAMPPLRPGTRAGFGLCLYGGHITLGLQADPLSFDRPGAQRLLETFVDEWQQWIARDGNHKIESKEAIAA